MTSLFMRRSILLRLYLEKKQRIAIETPLQNEFHFLEMTLSTWLTSHNSHFSWKVGKSSAEMATFVQIYCVYYMTFDYN